MAAERPRIAAYLGAEPDKTLALVATMDMADPHLVPGATLAYVCPWPADVVRDEPGRCPKCHMKLVPANLDSGAEAPPAHTAHHASNHGHEHGHGDNRREDHARRNAGIEWEDEMVEANRLTTPANTRWRLIDRTTGAEGSAIDWRFRVGDQVKIRLVNEMESDHPMHHPFHIHGAGRFLVLARDGEVEPNLMWKDTVLVQTGQVVDLLLDVTNPGVWMAHCHISEHHEAGMMISFRVDP
jgi:FtsP/CotA-like multicopper oxidase with cupredoxin domain